MSEHYRGLPYFGHGGSVSRGQRFEQRFPGPNYRRSQDLGFTNRSHVRYPGHHAGTIPRRLLTDDVERHVRYSGHSAGTIPRPPLTDEVERHHGFPSPNQSRALLLVSPRRRVMQRAPQFDRSPNQSRAPLLVSPRRRVMQGVLRFDTSPNQSRDSLPVSPRRRVMQGASRFNMRPGREYGRFPYHRNDHYQNYQTAYNFDYNYDSHYESWPRYRPSGAEQQPPYRGVPAPFRGAPVRSYSDQVPTQRFPDYHAYGSQRQRAHKPLTEWQPSAVSSNPIPLSPSRSRGAWNVPTSNLMTLSPRHSVTSQVVAKLFKQDGRNISQVLDASRSEVTNVKNFDSSESIVITPVIGKAEVKIGVARDVDVDAPVKREIKEEGTVHAKVLEASAVVKSEVDLEKDAVKEGIVVDRSGSEDVEERYETQIAVGQSFNRCNAKFDTKEGIQPTLLSKDADMKVKVTDLHNESVKMETGYDDAELSVKPASSDAIGQSGVSDGSSRAIETDRRKKDRDRHYEDDEAEVKDLVQHMSSVKIEGNLDSGDDFMSSYEDDTSVLPLLKKEIHGDLETAEKSSDTAMNFTESFTEEFASIEDDGEEEDEDDPLPLFTLDGKTEKEPDPPGSPEASASQDFPESPELYISLKPAKCPESSKSPERSKSQPRIEEITDEEKHSDVFTETSGAKRKKLDRQYKNYNLETLLRERKMKKQTDKELKQMKKELQQNIKGGKVQLQSINIEVSDDDLSAEHQNCLGKIEIRKETIQEVHSGDLVFRPPHYRCLFSYPGNLTPSNCGIAGSSPIDQHLVTLPPDMLLEFIAGDIIVLCYKNISKGHELLNWLFYLMSVHHKSLVILRCYHILSELLLLGTGSAVSWWPGPKLMATILTNYGADLEALSKGLIDETFTRFPIDPHQNERGEEASGYRQENLHNVLLILTEACEKRRNCMTDEDVKKIMMMLFKVSLDTTLITSTLRHDLMVCMAGLLEASSEKGWNDMILSLAGEIPLLTSHHHNRLSLVQLLPPCGRCEHFRRKLAYSMVQRILWGSFLVEDVASLRVEHILPILDLSHFSSPEDIDFYLMSSVIRLADLAVGNEGLPSSERDDLHRLKERLRGLLSDVRHDDLRIMDRTVVKDLMHRILSKWTFMSHNMGKKQGTIFAWASQGSQNKPIVHGGCSKNEVENTQDES